MKTNIIARVNRVDIMATCEEQMVPIRPICEAIGVSMQGQLKKIKEDPILASTINVRFTVGADSKQREMQCLPLEFVFGWIFTINTERVSDEAKELVIKYKKECYHALYRHFFGAMKRRDEQNKREIELLEMIADDKQRKEDADKDLRQHKADLDKLRSSRLDDLPSLFDGE